MSEAGLDSKGVNFGSECQGSDDSAQHVHYPPTLQSTADTAAADVLSRRAAWQKSSWDRDPWRVCRKERLRRLLARTIPDAQTVGLERFEEVVVACSMGAPNF